MFFIINVSSLTVFSDEYQDFVNNERESFQNYKDARDAEFIGFLKEQWKEFKMSSGLVRDEKPKPAVIPLAPVSSSPLKLPPKVKIVDKIVIPPKPVEKPVQKTADVSVAVAKPKPEPIVVKPDTKPSVKSDLPVSRPPEARISKSSDKKPEPEIKKPVDKPIEKNVVISDDKPLVLPSRVKEKIAEPAITKPVEKPVDIPIVKTEEKPVVKPTVPLVKPAAKPVAVKIDFYSAPVVIYGTYNFPKNDKGGVNKEMIASFWDKMSQIDYDSINSQVMKYTKDFKLNDWGYHYILYRLGMAMYDGNKNMANLFVWYMSSKAGFESRIGYNESKIYLLMPSSNKLYSIPFLTINDKKYYALFYDELPSKFSSLYTYNGNYPDADKQLDFRITKSPDIPKVIKQKDLKFEYNKKNYDIPTGYNKNLVDLYKYYPQTNLKVYFDATVDPELEYSLIKSLKPMVEGKSEPEAVNYLLRLVQKSFVYKTDEVQFGYEKYKLPVETVFYPYSDCKDRAFFFAFLVKRLVGLEVVGLDYPGHVATAVRFTDNLSGDYVMKDNKKYIICDPTYINANLGMAMPQLKNVKPEIVRIDL